MKSLIAIYDGDGQCVARCDERCWGASSPDCDCGACGGMNHGVGLARAQENAREIAHYMVAMLPEGQELRLGE